MDVDLRFAVFDVVGQIAGVLPERLRLDDAQLRDAQGYVVAEIYHAVQSPHPILKMEYVDLWVIQQLLHPLPEVPRFPHAQNFLAVQLDTGASKIVLLHECYELVLPLGQAFQRLHLPFPGTKHQREQATILYHMAVDCILHTDYMVRREPEIIIRAALENVLVTGKQPVFGLCCQQSGVEYFSAVAPGKMHFDVVIEQLAHPQTHLQGRCRMWSFQTGSRFQRRCPHKSAAQNDKRHPHPHTWREDSA